MEDLYLRYGPRDGDDDHPYGDDDSVTGRPTDIPTNFPYSDMHPTASPTGGDYPNYSSRYGGQFGPGNPSPQPTTLSTAASTYHSALPDQVTTTHSTLNGGGSATSAAAGLQPDDDNDLQGKGHDNGGVKIAAGAVPAVLLVVIGAAVFFWLRKRKRSRQQAASQRAQMAEMKVGPGAMVTAHYASSPPSPPPAPHPQLGSPLSQQSPSGNPMPPQPVILGPIVSGSNGAYLTGIDTSDALSTQNDRTNDRTGLGNPFADGDSLAEEPPPPYRPRSMATSRNSSVRVPPSIRSQTSLIAHDNQPVRSPFADPDPDDAVSVSELSGPTIGRNHNEDTLSAVSDLSYQHEPVAGRPPV